MQSLKTDAEVIQSVFDHIDNNSTDLGDEVWRESTDNYLSADRFAAEMTMIRRLPVVFAPSAALSEPGAYIARPVGGVPIIVVRDLDRKLHAFRNACRHRGAALCEGQGNTRVFRCPYHAWAYALNGDLQHIPHEAGFPSVTKADHGLVPIHGVSERGGLVFVAIEEPMDEGALQDMPALIPDDHAVFDTGESEYNFNWKLNIEATLEGYHIKPTHEESFYPYGYDNLNVVETYGANGRVTFPFRRIERLRQVPPDERDISGLVTFAHNVFPICTVAVLSNHISVQISEPISPSMTHYYSYRLGPVSARDTKEDLERMRRDARFVSEYGLKEDLGVVKRIQNGLKSGANTHFVYGHFEKAIIHFLKNIDARVRQIE